MRRFLFPIFILCMVLAGCGSNAPADAAVLVNSPNGTYTTKTTLAAAIADPASAGSTIVVTSALSAVQSNISSATVHRWPADRTLSFEGKGTLGNTTIFRYGGDVGGWGRVQRLAGAGRVELSSGAVCPEWFQTNTTPGTTEMAAAIQKAVDALPSGTNFASQVLGGTVSYDRSRYKVSTRINTKRGVSHVGQGPESTQFMVATANGLFYYEDTGNSRQDRHVFKSFGVIQSGATATSGAQIQLLEGTQKSQTAHIEDVHIDGGYYGINAQALIASSIENCRISSTVKNGIRIDGTVASTSTRISDTYVDLAGDDGIYIKFGGYITLINTASDSGTGRGYYLEAIEGLSLVGAGAEQNAGDSQLYIKGCMGVSINGGQIVTPLSNLASHGIYLDGNLSAVQINSTNFRTQIGNTGFAIYGGGLQLTPVTVKDCLFNLNYTKAKVFDTTDANLRIRFENPIMRDPEILGAPGTQSSIYNVQEVENLVYGSPGSVVTVTGNPERETTYIKHYGVDTPRGWYNLIGFQMASSTPTAGTYTLGDVVWNTAAAPGGFAGWYCTTSGSFGTLTDVTGSIDSGSATMTINDPGGSVADGRYVTIVGVTGVKRVLSVNGTAVVLDGAADATVSGAAVQYSAPVLKTFGAISP